MEQVNNEQEKINKMIVSHKEGVSPSKQNHCHAIIPSGTLPVGYIQKCKMTPARKA